MGSHARTAKELHRGAWRWERRWVTREIWYLKLGDMAVHWYEGHAMPDVQRERWVTQLHEIGFDTVGY